MDLSSKQLISTKDAGKLTGYTSDYLARLARAGEVAGEKFGHSWFIDRVSLESFLERQKNHNISRAEELTHLRAKEYREHNEKIQKVPDSLAILPQVSRAEKFVPDLGVGQVSLRSQALALSVAFLVVVSGATFSLMGELSQFTDHTATVAQEFSYGFNETFGDIPSHIVSGIAAADTAMKVRSALVAEHSLLREATTNVAVASPSLAGPVLPEIRLETLSITKSNQGIPSARAVMEFNPASVLSNTIGFGNAIIEASHAAIQADVSIAYGLAAFAPESARSIVMFVGTAGAALESGTSQVPALATTLYLRTAAEPVYLAPALAQTIFGAEYAMVDPFVAFSNVVSERYLALIEDAGHILYASASETLALSSVFSHSVGAVEETYLSMIGGTAVAINDTVAVLLPMSARTSPTAPAENISGYFESASRSGLAAVLPAFSAVKEALSVAYETISASFGSTNRTSGNATILAGDTFLQIDNPSVNTSTKIFVTFNTQIMGIWWVSDRKDGSFRVMLSSPQASNVSFDYLIAQ